MLLFIDKVKTNRDAFALKLIQICKDLGIENPNWLMFLMNSESGLNHTIVNPYNNPLRNPEKGATGLIQFMPSTAKALGTSNTALQKMTNVQQLDFVKKYFVLQGAAGRIKSFVDAYFVVFFPAAIGKPDSWVFQSKNLSASAIANSNKIFDLNKDSLLTVAEVKMAMLSRVPKEFWSEFTATVKVITDNVIEASKKKVSEISQP